MFAVVVWVVFVVAVAVVVVVAVVFAVVGVFAVVVAVVVAVVFAVVVAAGGEPEAMIYPRHKHVWRLYALPITPMKAIAAERERCAKIAQASSVESDITRWNKTKGNYVTTAEAE